MSDFYKFAGVSRFNGAFKFRVANDPKRAAVLQKGGNDQIDIIELKEPMTKIDALAFLISIDFDNGNVEIRAAMDAELTKLNETDAPKEPKVRVAKEPKITMEKIRSKKVDQPTEHAETGGLTQAFNAMITQDAEPKLPTATSLSKEEILAQLEAIENMPF
jgi:hypothetical protein